MPGHRGKRDRHRQRGSRRMVALALMLIITAFLLGSFFTMHCMARLYSGQANVGAGEVNRAAETSAPTPTPKPTLTSAPTPTPTSTPTPTPKPTPTPVPTPTPKPTKVFDDILAASQNQESNAWNRIINSYLDNAIVAAECDHSGWIDGGRAFVIGTNDYGPLDTEQWRDVVALSIGTGHAMGLTAYGEVLFAGDNSAHQCELNTRGERAIAIAATSWASYAVLESGRVVMCGAGPVEGAELDAIENAATIAASESHVAVLSRDGDVLVLGADRRETLAAKEWKDIVQIDCANEATIALDASGTVHVAGGDDFGMNALDGTTNARAVAGGGNFCLAVMQDGSVQGAGSNSRGQIDFGAWRDVVVAECGYMHSMGLTQDGRRLFAGINDSGQQG